MSVYVYMTMSPSVNNFIDTLVGHLHWGNQRDSHLISEENDKICQTDLIGRNN